MPASNERLPAAALAAAGFDARRATALDGRGRVWLVTGAAGEIVLRAAAASERGAWLAGVLTDLSERFAVPRPCRVFDGTHVVQEGTKRWEAFSFLPGEAIGFDHCPTLGEVGAFLARFHLESLRAGTSPGPVPGGTPLLRLDDVVRLEHAGVTMGSRRGAARLAELLGRFASGLRALDYAALPRCVVHGDPTTFNVLSHGDPPAPSGLIDFELADIEAAAADIAFCLWRSGRASQPSRQLDYGRVEALVAGYHAVRPLTSAEAGVIVACLLGRGLQMLAKRTRLAATDATRATDATGIVAEVEWIVAHEDLLARSVARSMLG